MRFRSASLVNPMSTLGAVTRLACHHFTGLWCSNAASLLRLGVVASSQRDSALSTRWPASTAGGDGVIRRCVCAVATTARGEVGDGLVSDPQPLNHCNYALP